jgi:hypothetical protein
MRIIDVNTFEYGRHCSSQSYEVVVGVDKSVSRVETTTNRLDLKCGLGTN